MGAVVAAYWIGLFAFSVAPAGVLAGQTEPAAESPSATLAGVESERARTSAQGAAAAPAADTSVDTVEQPAGAPAVDVVSPGAESAGEAPPDLPADAEPAVAEATAAVPAARVEDRSPGGPQRSTTTRGDVFRVGGPVAVERGERVRGDATVILGSLSVDGEVTGDVVVIAGATRFGPEAVVRGDVTVVGGSLRQAPSAAVRGAVTHVGLGDFNPFRAFGHFIGFGGWTSGPWLSGWRGGGWFGGEDLMGTVMRLFLLALLASGIVLMARGPVERIARRAGAEPLKAGVVGVLAQMLVVPLLVSGILVLVISIVGIPLLLLLPFVVTAVGLAMLVGFSGAVLGAGGLVRSRMGAPNSASFVSVWAGVALILLPTLAGEALGMVGGFFRGLGALLALAGFLLEYAAWTAGLGALILNRLSPSPPTPRGPSYAGLPAPPPVPDPTGPPRAAGTAADANPDER